jgi:hypothetical protein
LVSIPTSINPYIVYAIFESALASTSNLQIALPLLQGWRGVKFFKFFEIYFIIFPAVRECSIGYGTELKKFFENRSITGYESSGVN